MTISTDDVVSKTRRDKRNVVGFRLSEDATLKVGIMKLATSKAGSDIISDAILLLYAAYATLPSDLIDSILVELKHDSCSRDISSIESNLCFLVNTISQRNGSDAKEVD